jgi:hypothetical protein
MLACTGIPELTMSLNPQPVAAVNAVMIKGGIKIRKHVLDLCYNDKEQLLFSKNTLLKNAHKLMVV